MKQLSIPSPQHLPTVTIGIPAYNEAENIIRLLKQIAQLEQKKQSITQILIISDGSTDNTVNMLRAYPDKRLTLIVGKKRQGKSQRISEICKRLTGDYLLLLDADLLLTKKNSLDQLVSKMQRRHADLGAPNLTPLPARNFFERCINWSVSWQQAIRNEWNNGDNYLCFKACLVLSQRFAKQLSLPRTIVSNDAFIYLFAKQQLYTTAYLPTVIVQYLSPRDLRDHQLQSQRYLNSQSELVTYFSELLGSTYRMPLRIVLKHALRIGVLHPAEVMGYLSVYLYTRVLRHKQLNPLWNFAISTKKVDI